MGVTISSVNIENRKEIGVRAGDTVRVSQKIQEKGKTRIQMFEGLVLARKHGNEPGATFTVRRVSKGVGVEKIFPLFSPMIDKIEIVRRSKVRRAKLYFIREKVAREIRKQMRNMRIVNLSTTSDIADKAAGEAKAVDNSEAETAKADSETKEEPKTEGEVEAKEEAPKEAKSEAIDNSKDDSAPAETKTSEEPKAEETKE